MGEVRKASCIFITALVYIHLNSMPVISICSDDAEANFNYVIQNQGWEEGVKNILAAFEISCYAPFLVENIEKTKPIILDVILNSDSNRDICVARAIGFSSDLRFPNMNAEYLRLAYHPEKPVRNQAIRAFAPICEPDQFSELLGMMVPGEPDLNKSILTTIRERKIFDPQLLIKWRKDEIEKDKQREKKLMRDWFLKEVDRTIAVLKEAQK